jgi:hypothetical protein
MDMGGGLLMETPDVCVKPQINRVYNAVFLFICRKIAKIQYATIKPPTPYQIAPPLRGSRLGKNYFEPGVPIVAVSLWTLRSVIGSVGRSQLSRPMPIAPPGKGNPPRSPQRWPACKIGE